MGFNFRKATRKESRTGYLEDLREFTVWTESSRWGAANDVNQFGADGETRTRTPFGTTPSR